MSKILMALITLVLALVSMSNITGEVTFPSSKTATEIISECDQFRTIMIVM